ncbi:MAG: sigma-70 family RNA polymerase sigma factor [Planctomycetales bacterium]|nr:sigma-70 family RNA polymerase sigma factor [Planctomycetales bacterium]
MSKVSQILRAVERGDSAAAEKLLPAVYDQLRTLAAARLASESAGQTLQPTALVHEAYIRLVESDQEKLWDSRGHFFAAAAEAMRRILIDRARRKSRPKHGGDRQRVDLESNCFVADGAQRLVALDEALERFEKIEPEKAKLVKLRYFAGMTLEEAAAVLGVSRITASRHWAYAKTWLYCALEDQAR